MAGMAWETQVGLGFRRNVPPRLSATFIDCVRSDDLIKLPVAVGSQTAQSFNTVFNSRVTIMRTSPMRKNAQAPAPQWNLHFYQNDHLATEVTSQGSRHVAWANDVVLAQLDQSQTAQMLLVDFANSVLGSASGSIAYSPYGYVATEKLQALLGFNGQWCDSRTQGYPLGAGRRIYNPALMRFCSIDPLSPFDKGGLHPTAYCGGDPVNRYDPTGQSGISNRRRNGSLPSRSKFNRPEIRRKLSLPDGRKVEDRFGEEALIDQGGWFEIAAKKIAMTRAKKDLLNPIGNAPSNAGRAQNETHPNRPVLPEYYSPAPQQHAPTRDSLGRSINQNTERLASGPQLPYIPRNSAFGYSSTGNNNFAAKAIIGFVGVVTVVGLSLHFGLKAIRSD